MSASDEYTATKYCPESIESLRNQEIISNLKIRAVENYEQMKYSKEPPKITIIFGDAMTRKNRNIHVENRQDYSVIGPAAPEQAIEFIKRKFGLKGGN